MLAEAFRQESLSRPAPRPAPAPRPSAPTHPPGWSSWGQFNAQAREAIEGACDGIELATAWGVVCEAVGVARGAVPPAELRMVVLARLRDFDARVNEFFDAGRVKAQSEREAFVERFGTFGLGSAP